MKKFLILTLILCMLFVNAIPSFALDAVESDKEVVFSVDLYSFAKNRDLNPELKTIQNVQNYEKIRQLLENIPFEEYNIVGAEDYFLKELDRYGQEGFYLEEQYSISISPRGEVGWGSYEGVPMRAVTSKATAGSYSLVERGKSFGDWVKGIIDFAMNWNPYLKLNIAYTILGNLQPQYVYSTDDKVEFVSIEDRESRVIFCQDVHGLYGAPSQYVGQIADEHVIADVYVTSTPATPYLPVISKQIQGLTHIYSTKNYSNQIAMKKEAYNNYMLGRSMISRNIPRATLLKN